MFCLLIYNFDYSMAEDYWTEKAICDTFIDEGGNIIWRITVNIL